MEYEKKIHSYYIPKLKDHHQDFQILGWEDKESQLKRFEVLTGAVNLHDRSICDVGCGLGSLLEYFTKKNIQTDYTGIDLIPELINKARTKHTTGHFICSNFFEENGFEPDTFDIIYSSGMFNINLGNNMQILKEALLKFSRLGKKHIIFNLLHFHSPAPEPDYFYYNPQKVKKMIEKLDITIKKVTIISGYLSNDFTVLIEL